MGGREGGRDGGREGRREGGREGERGGEGGRKADALKWAKQLHFKSQFSCQVRSIPPSSIPSSLLQVLPGVQN